MKTQTIPFLILLAATSCAADVVTIKNGDTFTGTVTLKGEVIIVESRFQGITVLRNFAKADVISIQPDEATRVQPISPEEAAAAAQARKDKARQADADNQAKAQADVKDQVANRNTTIEQLNNVNAGIAEAQRKRDDAQTRIVTLSNQADADVAGAQRDYRIESSVPHPDNQDLFRTAALETRDKKVAAIRSLYGSKIAELQATVAQCDRDLLQLKDAYERLQKILRDQ